MKYLMFAIAIIFALFDVFAENLHELDAELVQLIEENKQTELQNFLKKKKQSTDAKNAALRLAVEKNSVKIACMLINEGANPRIKDKNGITSLMIAAIKNYPKMASMLMEMNGGLEMNRDSNIKDNKGNTALIHSVRENNMEVFNVLYNFCIAESWCKEVIGEALFIALELDRPEMAKILIKRLALIKQISRNNSNEIKEIKKIQGKALYIALKSKHIEIAKLLIEQDADLEYSSYWDGTPLMLASARGYMDIVKLLIEKGANVNAKKYEDTPLVMASAKGHMDIAKFLIEKGAEVNSAVYPQNPMLHMGTIEYMIRRIILNEAEKNETVRECGALVSACGRGDFDLVKLLLEKGANANSRGLYDTAIFYVDKEHRSEEDCIKLMKLLIEYGADVNARGKHGDTVLLRALRGKRFAVSKFLLKNGASVFVYNGAKRDSVIGYLIKYAFEKATDFVKKKIG